MNPPSGKHSDALLTPEQRALLDDIHKRIIGNMFNHWIYGSAHPGGFTPVYKGQTRGLSDAYLQGLIAHRALAKAHKVPIDTEVDGVAFIRDWKIAYLTDVINRVQPIRIISLVTQLALE